MRRILLAIACLVVFAPKLVLAASSGDLVKIAGNPAVYSLGSDGKRYVFPNSASYFSWYADFSTVKTVSAEELASYMIGGNVTYRPGTRMVKIQTDPKVYAISKGGTLRHVGSEAIATCLFGANWNVQIDDVPDAFFVDYEIGAPIAQCSDYDTGAERVAAPTIGADKGMEGAPSAPLPDTPTFSAVTLAASPAAGDSRRISMLRVLDSYRDARGFYRTWLSPEERYQCIDPGRDPNPADVTIQMNVLLMLAKADPKAARSLCQALGENVGDDGLWVYYARAPLVPWLRTVDLRNAGCVVEIPDERLAKVEGQERWMAVVRQLVIHDQAAAIDAPGSLALLTEIARDDFAELRRTPPLLYHNDLTASVSRYYWSEDFGYALWLRLYEKARAAAERSEMPTR